MNLTNDKYNRFALVKEMLETVEVVRNFKPEAADPYLNVLRNKQKLFLTGEGSSRIFPAKRAIYASLKKGGDPVIATEGGTQALEYCLDDFMVFGASNSGQTKELVRLFMKIKEEKHNAFFGLTANNNTKLEDIALSAHVLSCGKENAVAATKSVVEQALFYDALLHAYYDEEMEDLDVLADQIHEALTMEIPASWIEQIKHADMIYFAGRNTGVVEELTLKTNEITRKKSDYLEGTYSVHGIEEVMDKNEAVILMDPFDSEEEKIQECLVDGVGLKAYAISSRKTMFPTMQIPDGGKYKDYVELAAGWNLLVEIGIALGIDLDKPVRARKVGNEYTAQ